MNLLSFLRRLLGPSSSEAVASCERILCWIRDPLTHPEIERMDERERGDLPFNTGFRRALPDVGDPGCKA